MGLFGKKKEEKAAQGKSEWGTRRQTGEQPQEKQEHTEQMASCGSREGQESAKQQERKSGSR